MSARYQFMNRIQYQNEQKNKIHSSNHMERQQEAACALGRAASVTGILTMAADLFDADASDRDRETGSPLPVCGGGWQHFFTVDGSQFHEGVGGGHCRVGE